MNLRWIFNLLIQQKKIITHKFFKKETLYVYDKRAEEQYINQPVDENFEWWTKSFR